MKRSVVWAVVVAVAAVAAAGGLLRLRPDLAATIIDWRRIAGGTGETALPSPAAAEPAGPGESVDDGWCAAKHPKDAGCLARLPVVRLAGRDVPGVIGLETTAAIVRPVAESIVGNAEITYDEHDFAEVLPRVAGIMREVHAEHGQHVKPGDVLAIIDSAEVGTAKAQYLSALPLVKLAEVTLERTRELTRSNALPLKDELEASTALSRARADLLNAVQRLKNLGFTDADLTTIERDRDVSSLLRVLAPIDGTVVERHAVPGEAIDAKHPLATITNLKVMWAWIDVHEGDISRVKPGMKVELTVSGSGLDGQVFHGEVHWIHTAVNRTTRTIRVIAEIENPELALRANQFGRGTIILGPPREAVLVPRAAVQSIGSTSLVFRAGEAEATYYPQRVEIRRGAEPAPGMVEIGWGVQADQRVVTAGSYLLASELLENEEVASRVGR